MKGFHGFVGPGLSSACTKKTDRFLSGRVLKDAHGQTALEWAEIEGRSHVAEVLTLALKHHPMCL